MIASTMNMPLKSVKLCRTQIVNYRRTIRKYCSRNILQLEKRGLIADLFPDTKTNTMHDLLVKNPQTVYAGFDPTADSLHVGNLLVLLNLFHWQRSGHQAIVLLGGATARVGDPSGKSNERKEMYKVEVDHNAKEIENLIETIINNHELMMSENSPKNVKPIKIVNNAEWYEQLNVLDFLGSIGRNFRVGTMLGRQAVRDRLQSRAGMSFTEFSYQILQAYDWLHLFNEYNCQFQVGGNDQMGNIVAGHDLIQKVCDKCVYGLTVPIVTNEEGDKYGKTGGNAVWLSKSKTSPFQFYQFFIRTKDTEVQKLLMLYTFETVPRILEIMREHWKKPEQNLAQKVLAKEMTLLVHGEEGLKQAERITSALYSRDVNAFREMDSTDMHAAFEGSTFVELMLKPGTTVLDAAMDAGCFVEKSDAVRIISAGGFYINQEKVSNVNEIVTPASHILPNNVTLMRVGKKNYFIVKWLL